MTLRADVLARILVLQSMLREMPNEESLFSFMGRGLEDVPGVDEVWHSRSLSATSDTLEQRHFPLKLGQQQYGELVIRVSDPALFEPYAPYLSNLSFMFAVVLEERRLRLLSEEHHRELESRVQKRTQELLEQFRERQTAEREAVAARLRAERYLDVAEAIIVELNSHGNIVLINTRGCDLLGYTSAELIRKNWFDMVVPEREREQVRNAFRRMITGEIDLVAHYENEVVCKSGEHRHIAWHNVTCTNEQGKIVGTLSSGVDLTDRKRAEDALLGEKERLAVTLRSIGDGVITTDTKGKIAIMNPVAENLTGWTLSEAMGRPLFDVFPLVHEQSRETCENPVEKVLATGGNVELANHTLLIARDGTERAIVDSGAPIRDKNGDTIGVVLVFRDVTERQKLIEQVQRTDKLDSLAVLAGGIAHDFNNLLGGVFGYLELARGKCAPDSPIAQYLDKALAVYNRAKDLTQQLLTFSKGGCPIRKVGSIAQLVRDSSSFALSGSRIACDYQISEDLWLCNFDENQLGQVMDNLVINAIQAMPSGGNITICCENVTVDQDVPSLQPGRYTKVSVRDSGTGMPKDVSNRVFDPFFTTKDKGNGLGLSTCYSIIQKHEGHIEVDSELGIGTVFSFYLPAASGEVSPEVKNEDCSHEGKGRILILDDEYFIRDVLMDLLADFGYESIEAIDGDEALRLCKEEPGPIVGMLLDLTIPGGRGGKDIINELRELYPNTPIFASSGYSDDPIISKPTDFGFTASIRKPFGAAELEMLMNTYMS